MAKTIKNKAKAEAWKWFGRFCRVRDCLKERGVPFAGFCITCGRPKHIRYLQAGHCFAQRRNGGLFDEEAVHAQCVDCNEGRHGRPKKYRKIMVERYGQKKVDAMERRAKSVVYDRDMDFPAIAEKYEAKTNKLIQKNGRYKNYNAMMK